MKSFASLAFLVIFLIFSAHICIAQDMLSTYKPKNDVEKRIIAELKSLPEIQEHYASKKNHKPDIIINMSDSSKKYYLFQVGYDYPDRFSTTYYLSIDPKTLDIYFEDFSDESGMKSIPLYQWRLWRNKPEFSELHKWVNGKLVALSK